MREGDLFRKNNIIAVINNVFKSEIFFIVQVDIFQVCIIEMRDREESSLFHLEHFIEGKYIKYNSNSGFVLRNETLRCTPQVCLPPKLLKKLMNNNFD